MTIDNYSGCEKCPLRDRPTLLREISVQYDLMVLGEAPGQTEIRLNAPFVGYSGKLLRSTILSLGGNPQGIFYSNACICNPLKNKTPSPTIVRNCNNRLLEEIRTVKPKKILVVGAVALAALISPGKSAPITKYLGQGFLWEFEGSPIYVVATYHPAAVLRDHDLFRDFARDIAKFLAQDEPYPPPEVTTLICKSPEEALEYLEEFKQASLLSCDLETTGFSPISDKILSFGFGALTRDSQGVSLIIPTGIGIMEDSRVRDKVRDLLKTYPSPLVFHNLKFDLQFIQVYFQELIEPIFPEDTMLMQYALDERSGGESSSNSSGRSYHIHGLKDQARIRYDIPDYHFDFNSFYSRPGVTARVNMLKGLPYSQEDLLLDQDSWEEMFIYQGQDCYITIRMYPELLEELNLESPRLYELVRNILIPGALFFTQVEVTGAPIDIEYLEKIQSQMKQELEEMLPIFMPKALELGFEDFSPMSNPKVKDFLIALGMKNLKSTEKEVLSLELHKGNYSEEITTIVHTLIDYRHKARTLKKDIIGLLEKVDLDGRVRPDYLLHGTSTGRLACRDPNLQNIPALMGPMIRSCYVAGGPEDQGEYLLMEADESQLELRVAAWESQDEAMILIFENDGDIHRKVASDMFKKPQEEITKHERYLAKYVDFGVIYGRGAKSLTEGWEAQYVIDNLGGRAWTLQEAQALLDDFLNGVPGLKKWIEKQHKFVRENHYVETATGRRRRFPLVLRDTEFSIERQAVNTPIQSLGSDIVLSAAIRIQKRLPEGATIIPIIVHDSIMLRVRRDLISEVHDIVKEELETPLIPMNVPLKADFKIGWSWGKMVSYSEYDPEVNYVNYTSEDFDL